MRQICRALLVFCALALALPIAAAEVIGVVKGVDVDKKELQIDGKRMARGKSLSFVLDGETQVLFGTQKATVADIPIGRRVHVETETRDGREVAKVIRVNGAKPTAVPSPQTSGGTIKGVLRRVGITDREIVVIGPRSGGRGGETIVSVPESARITRGGKAAALESLKEDDTVTVHTETRDKKLMATTIEASPGR